ncbi:MAG: DUF309 domain-containing protein [Verrucomicrobiae bacterium]|nr:DUF309 domain-containing protein [Verrucomicrobiae bacterium]
MSPLDLQAAPDPNGMDARYLAFFEEFNQGRYFEAHEVLESLWLRSTEEIVGFYKGLIQIAGAFVHLSKSRSGPALRLLRLAEKHLAPYAPERERLDVTALLRRLGDWVRRIESGEAPSEICVSPERPTIRLAPADGGVLRYDTDQRLLRS